MQLQSTRLALAVLGLAALVLLIGMQPAAAQEAAARVDRLFPLSLASEASCQIGGVLATNAGGTSVLAYGNARALTLILDAVFLDRDWSEWRERLLKSGIAFGVVGTLEDIPDDPQMYASGTLVPMDDPRAGARFTVSSPLWIHGEDKRPPTMAPEVGEHTVEVLREFGFAAEEIDALLRSGAIAQGKPLPPRE